jgi:hypothetical protein
MKRMVGGILAPGVQTLAVGVPGFVPDPGG